MPPETEQPPVAAAPDHGARSHHPTSPSSLQAREACPCWTPTNGPSTEASLRGTAQHEAVEKEDISNLDDDESAAVVLALDIRTVARAKYTGPKGQPPIELQEKYLPVDCIDNGGWEGSTGGFADCILISWDLKHALVLDWKFGKFAVEPAANNTQGIAYALGALEWVVRNHGKVLESVTVEFVSPHIEERSAHTFTPEQYREMYARVRTIVARSLLGNEEADRGDFSRATPTTAGCLFCGRLAKCKAAAERFLHASKKYAPLELPDTDIRGLEALSKPVEAAQLLQFSAVAARWAKEVRGRVTEAALGDGGIIPDGYRVQITYPRKVTDVQGLFTFITSELDNPMPVEDAWKLLDLPLTPIEAAIKEAAPHGAKKLAVEEFGAKVEAAGLVQKSSTPVVSLRMKGKKSETEN
jgi:hypothetical protein